MSLFPDLAARVGGSARRESAARRRQLGGSRPRTAAPSSGSSRAAPGRPKTEQRNLRRKAQALRETQQARAARSATATTTGRRLLEKGAGECQMGNTRKYFFPAFDFASDLEECVFFIPPARNHRPLSWFPSLPSSILPLPFLFLLFLPSFLHFFYLSLLLLSSFLTSFFIPHLFSLVSTWRFVCAPAQKKKSTIFCALSFGAIKVLGIIFSVKESQKMR